MTECVELCRVALTKHQTPVSRIVSIAVKMLKRAMPGIRLVVSYADANYGHIGSIYQAAGWMYVGQTSEERGIILGGKTHPPPDHQQQVRNLVSNVAEGAPGLRGQHRQWEGEVQVHLRLGC